MDGWIASSRICPSDGPARSIQSIDRPMLPAAAVQPGGAAGIGTDGRRNSIRWMRCNAIMQTTCDAWPQLTPVCVHGRPAVINWPGRHDRC